MLIAVLFNLCVLTALWLRDHERFLITLAYLLVMNLVGSVYPELYWLSDWIGTMFLLLTGAYIGKRRVNWYVLGGWCMVYGLTMAERVNWIASGLSILATFYLAYAELKHCSRGLVLAALLYAIIWATGLDNAPPLFFAILRVWQTVLLMFIYFERAERHWRYLANSKFQGFLILSHDRVTFQNQYARELIGHSVIGKTSRELCELFGTNNEEGYQEILLSGRWLAVQARRTNGDMYITFVDITAKKIVIERYARMVETLLHE